MLVYRYDRQTKEYIGSTPAFLDKVATTRKGTEVYLLPSFATFIEPPKLTKEHAIQVWNGQKWEETEDYRGLTIYNVDTRQATTCTEIGPIPSGYALELSASLAELKTQYLNTLKRNFNRCIQEDLITIPKLELTFTYSSLEDIKKEQDLAITVSRDKADKIYTLTSEEYCDVINYLTVYGQLAYLQKWSMENSIKNCKNIELLETVKDKLDIIVDMKQVNNLVKMPEDKRNDYFVRTANSIK